MKKLFLIIPLLGLITGCGILNQGALHATDEYVACVETQMQVVEKALSVWQFESGKIRTFCGPEGCAMERYGARAIRALDTLDEIAAMPERSQEDLGKAFTSFGIILESMGKEVIENLAPRIFELIGEFV